ncbi:MAG TPA: S9 family peptidase [Cyclobacteriaceae bacterium]|nr:S9 family peptidase [Cyclobacteriaceae bacterium]
MKTKFLYLTIILFVSACGAKKEPEQKAKTYSVSQFMDVVQIAGGDFSPDETKVIMTSKETGIFNAYEITIATGEKKQVTNSTTDAVMGAKYFPNGDKILYMADSGGNEITHIYTQTVDGKSADLIQDKKAKASFVGWSYDKKQLYYVSNSRDKKFFDLHRMQISEGAEGKVNPSVIAYKNEQGLNPAAVSDDDRYIAMVKTITTSNSDMYLLDTQTGKTKHLSAHEGNAQFNPQYFSHDGKKLYYLTDEGGEFTYLASYEMATGAKAKVEEAPWDIMYANISRNGKYRVVGINNDARTEVKIYDESTGQLLQIPGLPAGDVTNVVISDSEKKMSFFVSSSKSPSNLFVYDFETKELKKLTDTMSKEIDENDLVAGEVVRFASYDGMQIPCLLYKPKNIAEGQKVPALLWIHGGPGGQTRLNYSPVIQHLVNNGYAILAVNNRGSSGYGKTFFQADDRKHGDADLKDCVEAKKLLATLPYIDMDKVGIMGGSYGGYMTMAALAFAPEDFKVGVNLFGVTNWQRTLKSIPSWWESQRKALYVELGDPFTQDSVALIAKSPLFHADKITKPFIVLQGSNDPRVLQVESDEIVSAARKNGVPVDYTIFPDEGHGFVKKENNIKASEDILKFLDKYLKGTAI